MANTADMRSIGRRKAMKLANGIGESAQAEASDACTEAYDMGFEDGTRTFNGDGAALSNSALDRAIATLMAARDSEAMPFAAQELDQVADMLRDARRSRSAKAA